MGPLKGIKVLDLSRILAGPWATQCLADFGATVWKIEKPGAGDDTRHWGPPFIGDESAYFLSINRNKESVALDFKAPRGRAILEDLIGRADVLVENFRPGVMDRLGIGYDVLKGINDHHRAEAAFKSLALALRQAVSLCDV